MEAQKEDPHRGNAVVILAGVRPDLLKAKRVNVAIPRHLLGRIDAAGGGNCSRFIFEAPEQKLAA